MRVLVVDDEAFSRTLLAENLERWGHEVVQARDGQDAWQRIASDKLGFVISDWMMRGLDGPDLCRRIRAAGLPWYTYVILLTARSANGSLIEGMNAGADDFIRKPFDLDELRARIRAGERVLQLGNDLEERNRRLSEANAASNRDLEAAAAMQKSLLPTSGQRVPGLRFAWLFAPSRLLAGDILNYFRLDERRTGFYLLDVAGHGIASAMLSFTLSKMLTVTGGPDGLVKHSLPAPPHYQVRPPKDVVRILNGRFQERGDGLGYFTMIYGVIDTERDRVTITQAGHPSPIHQSQGRLRRIGESGFPVGMLPDAEYEQIELDFRPGDRIVVYSDGVTECLGPDRRQFGESRLLDAIADGADGSLEDLVGTIERSLRSWCRSAEFRDDVSLLAVEREAPGVPAA